MLPRFHLTHAWVLTAAYRWQLFRREHDRGATVRLWVLSLPCSTCSKNTDGLKVSSIDVRSSKPELLFKQATPLRLFHYGWLLAS